MIGPKSLDDLAREPDDTVEYSDATTGMATTSVGARLRLLFLISHIARQYQVSVLFKLAITNALAGGNNYLYGADELVCTFFPLPLARVTECADCLADAPPAQQAVQSNQVCADCNRLWARLFGGLS